MKVREAKLKGSEGNLPPKTRQSRLFTVIMEFDGTTSVSQVVAQDVRGALRLWLDRLREPGACGLSRSAARSIQESFAEEDETKNVGNIKGVVNVWCTTALVGRNASSKLALLNIVKTNRR